MNQPTSNQPLTIHLSTTNHPFINHYPTSNQPLTHRWPTMFTHDSTANQPRWTMILVTSSSQGLVASEGTVCGAWRSVGGQEFPEWGAGVWHRVVHNQYWLLGYQQLSILFISSETWPSDTSEEVKN